MSKELSSKGKKFLKRGRNGILSLIFSRFGMIMLIFSIQFFTIVYFYNVLLRKFPLLFTFFYTLSVIVILMIINLHMEPTAKLTWFAVIAIFPIFGAILFLYTKFNFTNLRTRGRIERVNKILAGILRKEKHAEKEFSNHDPQAARLAKYLFRQGEFPIYKKTRAEYFPSGESQFEATIESLKKAKRFIFIESFIVEEGKMWGEVLAVLKEKAERGLDVRVLYDGMCEFFLLPVSYPKYLESLGIKCRIFSRIIPLLSVNYNYRDHRKLVVIDNKIAFTGGSNFADEYINEKERFGHWKDAGVMISGDAVKTFTLSFLEMWEMERKKYTEKSMSEFKKEAAHFLSHDSLGEDTEGYVLPFTDNPLDDNKIGENVYLYLFNTAKNFLHITTPYLILDYEMEQALKFASERGIDVKIIVPGIPDKKIPYAIAYTHYKNLLSSGVRIFEYTPGFIHQKCVLQDGDLAVIGTINLDYRSLYHHFENAVLVHEGEFSRKMENDFLKTLEDCKEIRFNNLNTVSIFRRVIGSVAKIFAPLM